MIIDGDFGPATAKTVKAFQKKHKLQQDGRVTPSLQGLIDDELNKDTTVTDSKMVTGVFLKKVMLVPA